jgi:hypothetical protein
MIGRIFVKSRKFFVTDSITTRRDIGRAIVTTCAHRTDGRQRIEEDRERDRPPQIDAKALYASIARPYEPERDGLSKTGKEQQMIAGIIANCLFSECPDPSEATFPSDSPLLGFLLFLPLYALVLWGIVWMICLIRDSFGKKARSTGVEEKAAARISHYEWGRKFLAKSKFDVRAAKAARERYREIVKQSKAIHASKKIADPERV